MGARRFTTILRATDLEQLEARLARGCAGRARVVLLRALVVALLFVGVVGG